MSIDIMQGDIITCDVTGCARAAIPCWLNSLTVGEEADDWLCGEHAAHYGYCAACGLFSAGAETFDFAPSGLCATCQERARVEAAAEEDDGPLPWERAP